MKKIDIGKALARNRFVGSIERNWEEETYKGEALNNSLFFTLEDMMEAYEEGFNESSLRKFILLKAVEINKLDLKK